MRLFLFALAIVTLISRAASAADVAMDDLLGRWCQSDGMTYTFTRSELNVGFTNGTKRTLKIAKIEVDKSQINIMWMPVKLDNNTWYELTADRRLLIQLANTTGDHGPRREFRRC
jgi:hypothetical protein